MRTSYREIFFSSALMGFQQVVCLAVGLVQAKIVAVLLGAAGTGMFGVYASLLTLAQSLFGMGVTGSGVRIIAAAQAPGVLPGREIAGVLRCGFLLGVAGCVVTWTFRDAISRLTFGSTEQAAGVGWMAAALALGLLASQYMAVLQGLRRLRAMAYANVLSAVLSAVLVVLLIHQYRARGVAPAFVAAAAAALFSAAWFSRRLTGSAPRMPVREHAALFGSLAKLGIGFMATPLLASLSAYAIRMLLTRFGGLETAGLYQASWTLATFYSGILLQAMSADFLPRISGLAQDAASFNRQVNEQAEVTLLLLVPGLLLCLVLAPTLLALLYTRDFVAAAEPTRWMLAGMMVRAAGWPLAFVPLALNRPSATLASEGLFAVVLVGTTAAGLQWGGLEGAGIAFLVTSLVYSLVLTAIAGRLAGFAWTATCRKLFLFLYGSGALMMLILRSTRLPGSGWLAWGMAGLVAAGCAVRLFQLLEGRRYLKHWAHGRD